MRVTRFFAVGMLVALVLGMWAFAFSYHTDRDGILGVIPTIHFALYVLLSGAVLAIAYVVSARDRRARRKNTLRVIALTLAVLFCVFVVEVPALFRIVDYRGVFGYSETWDPIQNRTDPELISNHRPGFRLRGDFAGAYAHTLGVHTGIRYPVDITY